jgi:hypothetical protein
MVKKDVLKKRSNSPSSEGEKGDNMCGFLLSSHKVKN